MLTISKAKPDQVFIVTDVTVRNTPRSCSTTSNFIALGSCVYEVLFKREKIEENHNNDNNITKLRRNEFNKDVSNIVNLTDVRKHVEKLVISEPNDNDLFSFDKGNRLKSIVVNEGIGTLTVHFLNKERKIHLIEYNVHYDKKLIGSP